MSKLRWTVKKKQHLINQFGQLRNWVTESKRVLSGQAQKSNTARKKAPAKKKVVVKKKGAVKQRAKT